MKTYHITQKGVQMNISDMKTDHLINTILLFKKRANNGIYIELTQPYKCGKQWVLKKKIYGAEVEEFFELDAYINELQKRKS